MLRRPSSRRTGSAITSCWPPLAWCSCCWSISAVLMLEDGRCFTGNAYGALGETFGEAVFATGMTGYQETLTDPSYSRQIVVQTAPHIGNTGRQ